MGGLGTSELVQDSSTINQLKQHAVRCNAVYLIKVFSWVMSSERASLKPVMRSWKESFWERGDLEVCCQRARLFRGIVFVLKSVCLVLFAWQMILLVFLPCCLSCLPLYPKQCWNPRPGRPSHPVSRSRCQITAVRFVGFGNSHKIHPKTTFEEAFC